MTTPITVNKDLFDITLTDFNQQKVSLDIYRDKKLCIFMWASWWVCRAQLPVWQKTYKELFTEDDSVEFLSIAMDAIYQDKVKHFHQSAKAEFTTLIDTDNSLSKLMGFKVVPNILLINSYGELEYWKFGKADIRNSYYKNLLKTWLSGKKLNILPKDDFINANNQNHQLSLGKFNEYVNKGILRVNEVRELELDNMIVRKQLWAKENPEKFYQGNIDSDWQKNNLEKGIWRIIFIIQYNP